jgi:hypothetical protein
MVKFSDLRVAVRLLFCVRKRDESARGRKREPREKGRSGQVFNFEPDGTVRRKSK